MAFSQADKRPAARFTFNDRKDYDEISGKKARMVGITYTADRFDNADNAVYLFGNDASFINLGTYKALKPVVGSISLWVKVEYEIQSGKGHKINPIIITKSEEGNDFYEAYAIYYMLEGHNVGCVTTRDSLRQSGMPSSGQLKRYAWHHLVMTYDDSWLCFYIDGKQQGRIQKNFQTKFLSADSVLIGISGNKKNNRFLNGAVDDIEIYDRVLPASEVTALYNAPNPDKDMIILRWVLILIGFALLVASIYFFIRYRLSLQMKKEKQRLELYNIVLGTELRVNRSLMNPHFVFNSLNALHNFILANEIDNASDYLIKFSKLIRKILESNMNDSITLEKEVELLKGYLEIENLRFEQEINFTLTLQDTLVSSAIHIPVMLIQPFVENAIWHGLLDKQGEKKLDISFSYYETKYICCTIEDNGSGRKAAEKLKNKKESLATNFVLQRLDLLNKIHQLECQLNIIDKPAGTGTIVKIILPILK